MKKEDWMEPPWNTCEYSQRSMGWRMGGGEDYLATWHGWFYRLSQEEQQIYITHYPEPEDWFEFYHLCLVEEDYFEILDRAERLRNEYLAHHSVLALQYERIGYYEQALRHLEKVIKCKGGFPAQSDANLLSRYAVLKRHVTKEMALKPSIRASWHTLRQLEHRVSIAYGRVLSLEEYTYLQKGVLFPSDMGRSWTKYLDHNTLYIHRHWREPCLFLLTVEYQEDHLYHLSETWMNPDVTKLHPLKRDPRDLLGSLISRLLEWAAWGF